MRYTASRGLTAAVVACALAAGLALGPATALGGSGGVGAGGTSGGCKSGSQAKLRDGLAIPPCSAPQRIKDVIAAANEIAKGTPYCYGGGHASFKSSCYDCSGAVSYALHGGRLLDSPLDSSGLMRWARHGKGGWLTVYANPGHAFLTVAGLRFDTSDTKGAGPGWASTMGAERPGEYRKRHKANL